MTAGLLQTTFSGHILCQRSARNPARLVEDAFRSPRRALSQPAAKQDVFEAEPVDVMAIEMASPAEQVGGFREIEAIYPDLVYYGADLTISTRYMARYGVSPPWHCAN